MYPGLLEILARACSAPRRFKLGGGLPANEWQSDNADGVHGACRRFRPYYGSGLPRGPAWASYAGAYALAFVRALPALFGAARTKASVNGNAMNPGSTLPLLALSAVLAFVLFAPAPATADTTAPTLQTVAVDAQDGKILTLTFDEDLVTPGANALSDLAFAFAVQGFYHEGILIPNVSPNGVAVSGRTVTLTFGLAAHPGRKLTVSYVGTSSRASLRDAQGNRVASFTRTVTPTASGAIAPVLTDAVVAGTALTLIFDRNLDAGSAPWGGRFVVGCGTCVSTISRTRIPGTGTATVSGKRVSVTLASAVPQGESYYKVSYGKGGDANPLRGASSGPEVEDIAEFFAWSDGTPPALVEGAVAGTSVTLYYDKALDLDSTPATADFTVTAASNEQTLSSVSMSETAVTLTLASAVAGNQNVAVTYTAGTNPIRGLAGNNAANLTNRQVTNRGGADPGKPALATADPAVATGRLLTLTYDQPFDADNVPEREAFTVLAPWLSVAGVAVRGSKVVLSLTESVFPCTAAFAVSYEKPAANTLRNVWGTQADGFSEQAVTNTRADDCDPNWVQDSRMGSIILTARRPFAQDAEPRAEWFTGAASGGPVTVTEAAFSPDDPRELKLTLSRDTTPDEAVTVSYRRPAGEPGLWDVDGNQLGDVVDRPVANEAPPAGPSAPESATFLGTALTLTFDRGGAGIVIVDTPPLVHGFTVDGLDSGSMHPSAVAMDNRTVTLELGMGAEPGQTVTVSYDPDMVPNTDPSPGFPEGRHNPLRYTDGTLVEAFSVPVTILAPKPATGLSASFVSGRTVDLSWTLPAQPEGVIVTAVKVHSTMTEPGGEHDTDVFARDGGTDLGADATSQAWPIIHGDFAFSFGVRLVTNAGDADSQVVTWSSDQEYQQAATGLTASNATQTTVDLAWTWPEQPAWVAQLAADKIWSEVRQQEADGTWSTVAKLASDATAHTVTGLSAGTAYSFRIALRDGRVNAESEPVSVTTPSESPLTAAFIGIPVEHSGKELFAFELRFSENFPGRLRYKLLRDEAFQVENGRVRVAKRMAKGQNQRWTISVRPASHEDVVVTLPAATDCAAPGAVCTEAGRMLSNTVTVTVPGPAEAPLTAAFIGMPAEHNGKELFTFELRFSENFPGRLRYKLLRDEAFQVENGRVQIAKRMAKGQNQRWTISVRPASHEDVVMTLPAATDCASPGAVCTEAGRRLSNTVTATVEGPAHLSVADARAREGVDEAVVFPVTLSRATPGEVTVAYATRNGTAKAGEDYERTRGTLTFAAGETEKTVSVPILDDALDEGRETFTLKLTGARGAAISDGEAIGTIENSDPLQKMWLSRFGRTVADHVTGAVSDRLAAPLTGAQVTVGGQTVDLADVGDEARLGETLTAIARIMGAPSGPGPANDDGWGPLGSGSPGSGPGQAGAGSWPGTGMGDRGSPALDGTTTRDITGRELLLGSAFHLAREGDGRAPGLAAWGRVTVGGFDGEAPADEGNVRIDGNVTTGILGADAEWGRMLAGVAVSVSEGEGTFAQPGVDSGSIESTMTTVSPYARVALFDRITAWGLAGYGTGDMTIVQKANEATGQSERITRTDLSMRLAALGGRGALLTADENGGIDLALKADGFFVETTSEAVSNEGDTSADASRVRLALEGSRAFQVGGGVFTPGLELGLRHDGGDAETGTGVELGGRLSWADPETGLGMDLNVRALVAHEDSKYREWGASGAVRLAPGERGRGLSFSLAPTWGAPGSGVDRLWSARDARGLAPGGGDFEPESRLEGELGYGMALLGDRFTGTPNVGFGLSGAGARDYRIGWRFTSVVRGDPGFEVTLDATRREPANDNGATPVEHGVMLRSAIRW